MNAGLDLEILRSDVLVEVLDARIPETSACHLSVFLSRDKPVLRILNKIDLADPSITAAWLRRFGRDSVISISLKSNASLPHIQRIPIMCRRLVDRTNKRAKATRAVIIGIPNVGKSSLINRLIGRRSLIVRNQPGVTRRPQLVRVASDLYFWDTPGVLSPSGSPDQLARLSAIGAMRPSTIDLEATASTLLQYLAQNYPDALRNVYRISELSEGPSTLLEALGRRRGCLAPGGTVDLTRASLALIQDLRDGRLGRISLEKPSQGI